MTIHNQKQAVNLRIQKSVALLMLVIAMGLIYFANVLRHGAFGFSRDQIAVLIIVIFTVYFLIHFLRKHNYIYYSDTGDKFILRYFSLRPLAEKKNSIEFNKSELYKFELKQSFFGFNESIIIFRNTPKGIAKYPPVSITALSKKDKIKMLASFQKLIMTNQTGR